ncbi:uracil-DNA glycosylase family protein [Halorhabdus sp. BNX81]|uniref:uracil-DNA glycosylase family protein n=1 Tax=Halorhabdus sp. BNX81 TaxID=2980181 RepID=UPI0023DCF6AE|nr:uracil-DNA glycosylase family protein [Halorhabdus sp. BNX81]
MQPRCRVDDVTYVSDAAFNPFGFDPDDERFVPGYGDVEADFQVIGDHPGIHGGVTTSVPFTETAGADRLQDALVRGGLLRKAGTPPTVDSTYLSYLHPSVPERAPSDDEYTREETFLEAEVRAIAAHVLLPVGERATRWVFENMTTEPSDDIDMAALHATEIVGSGWLVVPIADPDTWDEDDGQKLADALRELQQQDYRREADLGRLAGGGGAYYVR